MKYLFLNVDTEIINILFYENNTLIKNINCSILKADVIENIILENNIKILGFKDKSTLDNIFNFNIESNIPLKYFLLDEFFQYTIGKKINLQNKDILFCITLFNYIKLNFKQTIIELFTLKNIDLNKKNILIDKNILITGKITGFTRGELFQKIRALNGIPCSTYSDKVSILIKGNISHKTTKLIAVENAISKGKNIIVLNETEFKKIILDY